jgi:LAS superfamily LD-carboxypeptidase LdcB
MATTLNFTLSQVIKNTSIQPTSNGGLSGNEPIPVRVLGVILNEEDSFFINSEIPNEIKSNYFGIIKFIDYNNPIYNIDDENSNITLLARPINSNIKHYPLKNEIVYVLTLPNQNSENNLNTYSFYYYPPINMRNNISSNPIIPSYQLKNQNFVSLQDTEAGLVINSNSEQTPIKHSLGRFFPSNLSKMTSKIFEGDIMYEGRFGNSLRFSSDLYGEKEGKGEPLTILTNQAGDSLIEDINKDKASVYLTTNQQISINVASKNLNSFNITLPTPNIPTPEQQEELSQQIPRPVPTQQQIINEEKLKVGEFNDIEELGIYKDNKNQDTLIYKIINPNNTIAAIGEKLVNPFLKMREAAAKDNVIITINSGFRPAFGKGIPGIASSQEELRIQNLLPQWRGKVDPKDPNLIPQSKYFSPLTSPPGKSDHGDSNAIDIQVEGGTNRTYRWLVKNAEQYGFIRTVKSEPWHWVYLPSTSKFAYVPPNDPSWNGLA